MPDRAGPDPPAAFRHLRAVFTTADLDAWTAVIADRGQRCGPAALIDAGWRLGMRFA